MLWRFTLALVISIGISHAAAAWSTTLSVQSNKSSYQLGETIVLTVIGDAQGATTYGIYGRLIYDALLTKTIGSSQTRHTSAGVSWVAGVLSTGDGFADMFNQIAGLSAQTPDQIQIATATLVAELIGVVQVSFRDDLDYFGMASPPGISFTILPLVVGAVPEPATAGPLSLGLLGLALIAARRRVA